MDKMTVSPAIKERKKPGICTNGCLLSSSVKNMKKCLVWGRWVARLLSFILLPIMILALLLLWCLNVRVVCDYKLD